VIDISEIFYNTHGKNADDISENAQQVVMDIINILQIGRVSEVVMGISSWCTATVCREPIENF